MLSSFVLFVISEKSTGKKKNNKENKLLLSLSLSCGDDKTVTMIFDF